MKNFFKVLIGIIQSKECRLIAAEAIGMIKAIIKAIKAAKKKESKGGSKITKEEKKYITKVALSEFKEVTEAVIETL